VKENEQTFAVREVQSHKGIDYDPNSGFYAGLFATQADLFHERKASVTAQKQQQQHGGEQTLGSINPTPKSPSQSIHSLLHYQSSQQIQQNELLC